MEAKTKEMSQSDKLLVFAILVSVPLMIFVGILIGILQSAANLDFTVILIGIVSSQIYRRLAKGFSMKVAIASVLTAFLGLVVAEMVRNFGVEGLLVAKNFVTLFNFVVQEDINKVSWSVYRLITLVIAYSYSRVV